MTRSLTVLGSGLLALALTGSCEARGPKVGVFGKINGKPFNAPALSDPLREHCVVTSVNGPSFAMAAAECRGSKNRRHPKRNWKQLGFACSTADNAAIHPPQDLVCIAASYTENARTKRSKQPKTWSGSYSYPPASTVTVRIESIEGAFARGSFSGVFDAPATPATSPATAGIQSGTFYVPLLP